MPVVALLTWKHKYDGYVVPSWHHFDYPPLWCDAADIGGFRHFCEKGLLKHCSFAEGGKTGLLSLCGTLLTLHWCIQGFHFDCFLSGNRTLLLGGFFQNLSISHGLMCERYWHESHWNDSTLTNHCKPLLDGCTSRTCSPAKGGRGMETVGDAHDPE